MTVWFVALQEIIQNADDAGATKVSFLLDSRPNFFGKNSLYEPSLAKFQGPALYAQNNALFEEEDWENLERLMRSSKKDDPLKVGRFGIGFNSVYHMTGKCNNYSAYLTLPCPERPQSTLRYFRFSRPPHEAIIGDSSHTQYPRFPLCCTLGCILSLVFSGAPNEDIVENQLNIALLNVF